MKILGIDIGGTGIKGAVVDTSKGVFKTDRLRILTPQPATPEAVSQVLSRIVKHFDWEEGLIGCTFPGVVMHGTVHTAANLDKAWVGQPGEELFTKATGCETSVLNDADAAGLAEVRYGTEHAHKGVVLMITLGTGIGTALFVDGELVPNTELGHVVLAAQDAEHYAAESAREREDLTWEAWGARVGEYLRLIEDLFWPDLFVIGGGVSKQANEFLPLLDTRTKVVPATLRNRAGIVGAAIHAEEAAKKKKAKHKR
jgi:polyphosphate glucokinase